MRSIEPFNDSLQSLTEIIPGLGNHFSPVTTLAFMAERALSGAPWNLRLIQTGNALFVEQEGVAITEVVPFDIATAPHDDAKAEVVIQVFSLAVRTLTARCSHPGSYGAEKGRYRCSGCGVVLFTKDDLCAPSP